MSDQKLNPNRSPPARILLESSMETTSYSPSIPSYSKIDKDKSSKGLWKSLKSKANVFSIFERGKSPQLPQEQQQQQQRLQSCSPPSFIPLGASLNPEYEEENEEDDKLKNEYGRTYRRSCGEDRRKASARITITTAQGEYDFAYRPRITVEHPSGTYQPNNDVEYVKANQSTTALSAVSLKQDATDALLDFPDLGSDLAKYIRDGTPTPTATPTEEAAAVFGFIPFDQKVESYDDDFDLNFVAGEDGAGATPKQLLRKRKSVRFASNDTDIAAKIAAENEKAAEVHQQMYEQAKKAGQARTDVEHLLKKDSTSLLPRPSFPTLSSNQDSASMKDRIRTPSPTRTLRHQASNTSIAKRTPSPAKSPLRQEESMTFQSGRKDSPTRPPRGFVSPSKASLVQHTLTSPSKTGTGYVSPTKSVRSSISPMKALPALPVHMRSATPPSPEKLTTENTRANTPTSPTKLGSIRLHTPTSPSKLPPAHSQTSPSPTRKLTPYSPVVGSLTRSVAHDPTLRSHSRASPKEVTPIRSHTPTTPITAIRLTQIRSHTPDRSPSPTKSVVTSAHDSMMRGKEAHEESARRKAIEVAEFRQQQQKLLTEKRVREDRMLREKRSEVELRRKASQGVLREERKEEKGPMSPPVSRLPVPVPKATGSRLPVLKRKESTVQMRRPGVNASVASPMLAPTVVGSKTAKPVSTPAVSGVGTLKPKECKQSLRPKASTSQLGSIRRTLPPKPVAKSKVGQGMERK